MPGVLRARDREQPGLALACRAEPARTTAGRINGQKVWTSLAQYAQRCVLLTRTGTPESAHKGITALFVDMDSAGITVRPIETMHGARGVLRGLLRRRRGAARPRPRRGRTVVGPSPWTSCPTSAARRCGTGPPTCSGGWQRARRAAPAGALDPAAVGEVTELLWAFRARSRATQRRLAPARRSAPRPPSTRCSSRRPSRRCSTSSPKALAAEVTLGDDPVSQRWRAEFLYSRAATIYGGSAEIQRNIIARRLLDLGDDR